MATMDTTVDREGTQNSGGVNGDSMTINFNYSLSFQNHIWRRDKCVFMKKD